MPLSTAQQTIAQCEKRMIVVCAGRRFGKTFLSRHLLARAARLPNQNVVYLAPSYRMAKGILWKPLKEKLQSINWVKKINETELSITLVNGSVISLKGAENFDSLRGLGISYLVLDEVASMSPEVWGTIRPTLSDTGGRALFIGTPMGMNHFKDLFDMSLTNDQWASFSFTTLDGGNVPEEEVLAAQQDLSAKVFSQEYLATFENFSGVVMGDFGEHNIAPVDKPSAQERLIVGMDFNVTPGCAVIGRQTKNGLEIFDELYIENTNTNEMILEIRNRYPSQPIVCFPDPAGVQRKTSANGNTDIKILEMAGWDVRYHRSHPLVKDRINAANSVFHLRPDGTTKFKVDPRCRHLIKCLRNWTYKEGTMQPNKDGNDHMVDAATYAIEYLYPITVKRSTPEPQRWGHNIR